MDYIKAWQQRARKDEQEKRDIFRSARDAANQASQMLIDEFGARKVYLFGSLLDPHRFRRNSDIDIAVEGLKVELYFKALSRIWDILPKGMKLDLVPMEDADEYTKLNILNSGLILHEKQPAHS